MNLLHRHEEQVVEKVKYLEPELSSRVSQITPMRIEFVDRVLKHGYLEKDLPELIAAAMTDGIFPTIANHKTSTSEGYLSLLFITILPGGKIPPEAIDVSLSQAENKTLYGVRITLNGPERHPGAVPGVLPGYEDQYRVTGHDLPYRTNKIMDEKCYEFIAMMDTHIPDPTALYTAPNLEIIA